MPLSEHLIERYSRPEYAGMSYYGVPIDSMTREELLIVARSLAYAQARPRRIPIRPVPDTSGGKFDAKSEIETLRQIVRQLTDYVNELRRDVDMLQGYRE